MPGLVERGILQCGSTVTVSVADAHAIKLGSKK